MSRAACPELHNLQALLEGNESDGLAQHLETCADCRQTLEGLAAEPIIWRDMRALGEETRGEDALWRIFDELKGEEPLAAEAVDLSFLQPADRPGLLGMLDKYEVQEVIGRGGMGLVLKALDAGLNRVSAIKVLSPYLASSVTARRRFVREARAAAAVCHEHVVPVYGVSEAAGLPYLVMQYVAGESLQERLDRGEALAVADVARIGMQAALGLAAAHAQGLIHRDIKPANLLLENGLARVKITDFGLARAVDDVQVTQNGIIAGTPEYMAPEQARAEPIDHRADLFSLGAVLYAMCTGVPPFRGATALGVLRQVSDQEPTAIRTLEPDVPIWLATLVSRLMAKNPADRIQSAAEVATLLEEYLAHLRQPATVAAPVLPLSGSAAGGLMARSRHRLWFVLAAVICLGVALSYLFWIAAFEGPAAANQQVFHHDFRGSKLPRCFRLTGANAEAMTRSEAEGFRITVPSNDEQRDRVGLEMFPLIKGDFDITVRYEVIQGDRPKTGEGVGCELYIGAVSLLDGLSAMRLTRPVEKDVYLVNRSMTRNGKLEFKSKLLPAFARTGQLRMTRSGAEVTVWAAEEPAGKFRELCRKDFGQEDVGIIWLTAFVGGSRHGVDVRVIDLKIVADSVTTDEAPAQPLAEAARPTGWMTACAIIGLLITSCGAGIWIHSRRGGARPVPAGHIAEAAPQQAPPPHLALACSACAKKLRVHARLAGKTVKCPQCSKKIVVPGVKRRSLISWKACLGGSLILVIAVVVAGMLVWPEPTPVRSFMDIPLGAEAVPDIEESGFHIPEERNGQPFRWTNGNARLTIPINPREPPQALAMRIFSFRPRNMTKVRLKILANNHPLFSEDVRVPPWDWERTFDLTGLELGEQLVLDIVSDTFVPTEVAKTSSDPRTLGVQVRDIKLLSNND